jgi:transposase
MAKYTIKLRKEEVIELQKIVNKGSHSTQTYRAALILLNVDEGENRVGKKTNKEICEILHIGMRTIDRVKRKLVEGGMDNALERNTGSRVYEKKIDGDIEAKLIALACGNAPEGFARWSLRLLADKMVELNYIDKISYVSVQKVLKKTNLSPGKSKVG